MKKVIIVPTYNERRNIEELIPVLFGHVHDAHILVVDDNSPDGTREVVEKLQDKYDRLYILKREKKEGLGKAYIHAFREVLKDKSVDLIIMMDADFSHDPKYIPDMLRRMEDADVMIGSRYMKGGGTAGWELWRRFLSRGANLYCRTITRMPINDCTGGFNIMRTSTMRKIDFDKLDLSGYAFIMELKHAFFRAGAKFREHPILFMNRKEGESKMSSHIIREGVLAPWKMLFKK